MYPYHNMIKKRIKNGELIEIKKIKDEAFAFVFIFNTYPYSRPIRHSSLNKYDVILEIYKDKIKN